MKTIRSDCECTISNSDCALVRALVRALQPTKMYFYSVNFKCNPYSKLVITTSFMKEIRSDLAFKIQIVLKVLNELLAWQLTVLKTYSSNFNDRINSGFGVAPWGQLD